MAGGFPAWWRSPLLRTLWQLPLVLALSFAAVLVPTFYEAARDIDGQVQAVVEQEARDLDAVFARDGAAALVDLLRARIGGAGEPSARYQLRDRAGRILLGNLPAMLTRRHAGNHGWWTDETEGVRLVAREFVLDDGLRLLIGRISPLHTLHRHLWQRVGWAALAALLATFALAAAALTSYRRRLATLEATAAVALRGSAPQPIAARADGDELDALAMTFNRAFAEISHLLDAQRHLAASLAHDLRKPLAAVRYQLETCLGAAQADATQRPRLERALEQVDGALSLFGAVLQLARIEHAGARIDAATVWLDELLDELLATFAPVAAEVGRRLEVAAAHVAVRGDRALLFTALGNLVENALVHGGGAIHVALAHDPREVRVRVGDAGGGVPAADLERIFERFYRADPARAGSGSGVGLALVAAIARAHGGHVEAANGGPGLCVSLCLPRLADAAE